MRFKSVVILVVVLVACSLSFAANDHAGFIEGKVKNPDLGNLRAGTLGNLTVSITQTGALEAQVDVSATSASPGASFTADNLVVILGQIYDYPWQPPSGTDNTFISSGTTFFPNSTGLGTFQDSYTFTVNVPNTYQAWAGVWAGRSYTGPTYWFWSFTQSPVFLSGPTTYVDSTQPPTPTPDPNAGGAPIPTLNWIGMLAMVAMLIGVAALVIIRRR